LLHLDEGVHAVLFDVELVVTLQLADVGMLPDALDLAGCRVVEVPHVVLLRLQFLELPFDLR
jgi:hypothetical protein